jgi:voltage-gated potassium channel
MSASSEAVIVTIATLGYGDITPRLPLAQMLAVLEAVIGQFYVAVVIAWLVSAYAARHRLAA